ncbi:hypothetical protein MHU86_13647 [Fragilaria crotonensis]|nr:hypothetical protein MHU86_13647 [Fragilaria crotonensis]
MNICSTLNEICTTDPHNQMLDTKQKKLMNTLPEGKSRSAFAAIIAETYFIPGITGRARCLQDPAGPEMANTFISIGCYPEQERNSSAWEIERLSPRSPRRERSMVVWAETASFLRPLDERGPKSTRMKSQFIPSKAPRRVDVSDSRGLSDSSSRSPTVSDDDDSSEDSNSASVSREQAPVASNQGRLFTSLQKRWLEYQHDSHSSSRRSLLHEELESIQSLLTKQRARLASYDSLQGNGMVSKASGDRPAAPVRSSSSRSCRQHERTPRVRVTSLNSLLGPIPEVAGVRPTIPARTLSTWSCRVHESKRRHRISYSQLPPLVVSINAPQRKRVTLPPSA